MPDPTPSEDSIRQFNGGTPAQTTTNRQRAMKRSTRHGPYAPSRSRLIVHFFPTNVSPQAYLGGEQHGRLSTPCNPTSLARQDNTVHASRDYQHTNSGAIGRTHPLVILASLASQSMMRPSSVALQKASRRSPRAEAGLTVAR